MTDKELQKFRDFLVEADHLASQSYDKAVMTLSGGALGITITFLKDIVLVPVENTRVWLMIAWISFGVSLASILISYLFSMQSLRNTINQIDDGTIYSKPVGGFATKLTIFLRILASLGFLAGVGTFIVFAYGNY